jgi:hypothetical protein
MRASRARTAKKSAYMKDEEPGAAQSRASVAQLCEENRARREGNGECLRNSDV